MFEISIGHGPATAVPRGNQQNLGLSETRNSQDARIEQTRHDDPSAAAVATGATIHDRL
jgi:hypothetical protein